MKVVFAAASPHSIVVLSFVVEALLAVAATTNLLSPKSCSGFLTFMALAGAGTANKQ